MPDAQYTFLPWARQGLAATLESPRTHAAGTSLPPRRAALGVEVDVSVNQGAERRTVAPQGLHLFGPGDVTGIDTRIVVRTDPQPDDGQFKPNDVPLIEFSRPDFPWLFSPEAPDSQQRLRPWLCLACVPDGPGVSVRPDRRGGAVVLEIGPTDEAPDVKAGSELPPPADLWAWAHVQVAGSLEDTTLADVYERHPERVVARLVCPRNLQPHTRYHAVLVPVYEAGRRAGLGEDPPEDSDALQFAWSADTGSLRLPVYHHWTFATGFEGDFESLARLLEANPVPPTVGTRPLDLQDPGFDVPRSLLFERDVVDLPTPLPPFPVWLAPRVPEVGLPSALRTPAPPSAPEHYDDFIAVLARIMEAAEREGDGPTIVGPPVYGRWHAGVSGLLDDTPPAWLRTLNTDVRHRAAAGVGTGIVREQQEQLMAAAWDQVGALEDVNQLLRQGQLSRQAAGIVYRKHLGLDPDDARPHMTDAALQMTAGVHRRVGWKTSWGSTRTVHDELDGSAVPPAYCSPTFRRVTRPHGPAARRLMADSAPPPDLLQRLAAGTLAAADPAPPDPDGMQTIAVTVPTRGDFRSGVALQPADLSDGQVASFVDNPPTPEDPEPAARARREAEAFADAATATLGDIATLQGLSPLRPRIPNLDRIRTTLQAQLDPERTVCARVHDRLDVPAGVQWDENGAHCSLEPILVAPSFPEPMYRALRDRSQALLLSGLDQVPPNTITLVETNPAFVESYMAGLNHEMSAELLWREYPTDQRGTYFRHFWDAATDRSGAAAEDLAPMHTWDKPLGENLQRGGSTGGRLVLLLRGELLRLYPNTQIYAVHGVWDGGQRRPARPGEAAFEQKHPVFRGTMKPDVTFLGFDLTDSDARGSTDPDADPGWFFVLEGQPTEPRFGLDETIDFALGEVGRSHQDLRDANTASPWTNIAWGDLIDDQGAAADNEAALDALVYAPAEGRLDDLQIGGTEWGRNAAHMAYILLQLPVRLAIHADDMLPKS